MDIDKMYKETQQKIKQASNLEENTYSDQLLKQDAIYYTLLNELISFYPTYKVDDTEKNRSIYSQKLSNLNGISSNIQKIHTLIKTKIQVFSASLTSVQIEIEGLKEMLSNLKKNNGDLEELDLTSKRLLNDYTNVYTNQYIMVWLKGILVSFLLYKLFSDAFKYPEIQKYIYLWGICLVILFIIQYLIYTWNNNVSMPDSMAQNNGNTNTTSMTCNDTEFGCCPDGTTVSTKDNANCPAAIVPQSTGVNRAIIPCNQSTYGCCPDNMTISNITGSNCSGSTTKPPLCSRSQYGCCPDGNSVRNVDGSNCTGGCSYSLYGCCPNGVTISNADHSNCNVPSCASTRFGCCPNGTTKNQTGSNCA